MKFEFWCKSFLSIYKLLPALCDSIDNIIEARAISPVQMQEDGTYRQTNAIIALSQQKVNMINLKVLTDKTLVQLDEYSARLIINHFIDGISNNDCAKRLGLSRREYFRKKQKALTGFEGYFRMNFQNAKRVYNEVFKGIFWQETMEKLCSYEKMGGSIEDCPEVVCNLLLKRLRKII